MRALAITIAFVCACDGPSLLEDGGVETSASGEPHATLLGSVDAAGACGLAGLVEVVLRATIIGCDPPLPAPCTLPVNPQPIEGDRLSCPSAEPVVLLGVDVSRSGQWRVEAAYRYATGPDVLVCYTRPQAADPFVVVTTADLDDFAEIEVVSQGGACPGG